MNTDRDPSDQTAIEAALHAYNTAADRDEADVALEAVLIEQGVIRPDEVIAHIEEGVGGVTITLEGSEVFTISA